jgi:hypothetical protein
LVLICSRKEDQLPPECQYQVLRTSFPKPFEPPQKSPETCERIVHKLKSRRLPPLPPPSPDISPPIQQAKRYIEDINSTRFEEVSKPNKHNSLTTSPERPPNHYTILDNTISDSSSNCLPKLSQLTIESRVENLVIKDEVVESCRLNVDRIVLEGRDILQLEPELTRLLLGGNTKVSDCDRIREEIQKALPTTVKVHVDECKETEENKCKMADEKPIETNVIVNDTTKSDSSDEEAGSIHKTAIEPDLESPSRKNRSVRFQGSSTPVTTREKKLPEERKKRKSRRNYKKRYDFSREYEDSSSTCSTCSSSSSSDDQSAYELPPRKAYGGVRISYVPNDALAVARRRQQSLGQQQTEKNALDKNCSIS